MSTTDVQPPPEYEPPEVELCISCGGETGPDSARGQIGNTVGSLCDDCAHTCDGNVTIPARRQP